MRSTPSARRLGPRRGVPVVGLPGFLGDSRELEPLAERLAERRPVWLYDLPPGAPDEAAAQLAPQLERDLDRPADLITGSFGGLVARALPPALLRSLAAVATLPGPDLIPPGIRWQARVLARLPAALVERAYAHHLRGALARDGVPPALIAALCGPRPLARDTLLGRLRGVLAWRTGPPPACPTLWVRGATDAEAPWSAEEVQARWPGVSVVHVPGGHRPYASHPGPLVTALERSW